ncbi:MAG: DUF2800 domain-containing protein [Patescibacteria group bacterium]|nr:DUF2800 domain-containing protein [Patescibacteria group bacterium]
MSSHSALSPSFSEIWTHCSGAPRASAAYPDKSTSYTVEGSAAHAVAADCLISGRQPSEWLDRYVDVEGDKILVTEEMVNGVALYVERIREHSATVPKEHVWIEQRVNPGDFDPTFDVRTDGTGDAAIFHEAEKRLEIWDFKFGYRSVRAKKNPQTRAYALGYVMKLAAEIAALTIETIDIYICQPRDYEDAEGAIKHEQITLDELLEWGSWYFDRARATLSEDAPFTAGDHCFFCKHAGECAELRRYELNNAMVEFEEPDAIPTASGPPDPEKLSPTQLGQVLAVIDNIVAWARAVRLRAFDLINTGAEIPHPDGDLWKIVPKKGRRRWTGETEEENAVTLAMECQLPYEDLWAPRKLKSPAQIEATLKRLHGAHKYKEIAHKMAQLGLITKPISGTTLAPPDDAREPLLGVERSGFEKLD